MSHLKKFLCCLCLLIPVASTSFPQSVQTRRKKVEPRISQTPAKPQASAKRLTPEERAVALIGELLEQTGNFERGSYQPLQILLFKAKAAEALWLKDEPRARRLFAETFKSAEKFATKGSLQPGRLDRDMSTMLRDRILDLAMNCDVNFAEELVKSVTETPVQAAPTSEEPDFNLLSQQATLNLKLARKLAESDAPRAAQLIKASFNGWLSKKHIDVLKLLRGHSPALADETFLHGLSVVRLRTNNLSNKLAILLPYVFPKLPPEDFEMSGTMADADDEPNAEVIQSFLDYAYDEFMPKPVEAQVDENNMFGQSAFNTRTMRLLVQSFEKYRPQRAESFANRVREIEEVIVKSGRKDAWDREEEIMEAMLNQKVSELLAQAAEEENNLQRDELYFFIMLNLIVTQNDLEQALLISEKISIPESRTEAKKMAVGSAIRLAMKRGDLEKAYSILKRWPDQQESLRTYVHIANLYLKQNNRQRAAQILEEARPIVEKTEVASLPDYEQIEFADALSRVDAKQGFAAMKRAVEAINRSTENRNNGYSADKDGKITFSTEFAYEDGFAALGRADFDKALALAKSIRIKHSSALAQLAVCRGKLRE